ncbi:MAG TPA: hypothetical protein VNH64_05955 [Parvularculaceae bacterium]|nr:hypothetical protein [Parvularculaceae bacterium]
MSDHEEKKPALRGGSGCAFALIVVGILWTVLSGLCTATFTISPLFSGDGNPAGIIGLALAIGLPSIVIGLALWVIGHKWLEESRRRRSGDS